MESHRRALGPVTIVAVVLAAWVGFSAGDFIGGAGAALGILMPALVLLGVAVAQSRFDWHIAARMVGAVVLCSGITALMISTVPDNQAAVLIVVGLLLPAAVALVLSSPDLDPRTFLPIAGAALVALWVTVSLWLWSEPGEAGETFQFGRLWFGMLFTGIYMIFPALLAAFTWVWLEAWAGRHRSR